MGLSKLIYKMYLAVINIIGKASCRLSPGARTVLMDLSISAIIFITILHYCNEHIKKILNFDNISLTVSILMLVLLLAVSIDRPFKLRKVTVSRLFVFGWYLCFGVMLISSLFHHVNDAYRWWSILSLTIYPMFAIVWHERGDFHVLCGRLAICLVAWSFIFFVMNLAMDPFISNYLYVDQLGPDFVGMMGHPNSNGLVCMSFFTAALYLLLSDNRYTLVSATSLALCIAFTDISMCRTAQLAMILEAIVAAIIYLRHRGCYKVRWTLKIVLAAFIAAALVTVFAGKVLMYVDRMDLNAYAADEYEEMYEYVQSHETLSKINAVSSDRIVLWGAYLHRVSLFGHGKPSKPLFKGVEASKWAHNNAIDIWYASGFAAFVGYIIWLACLAVFILRCMRKRSGFRPEYLLIALAYLAYILEAMLEITLYPMLTGVVFLAFMCMMPAAITDARSPRL